MGLVMENPGRIHMPFQRVRFLNGTDKPVRFELQLQDANPPPGQQTRQFGTYAQPASSEIQTIQPQIPNLVQVSIQPMSHITLDSGRVLNIVNHVHAPVGEEFHDAIVSIENHGDGVRGQLWAITDLGNVVTEDFV